MLTCSGLSPFASTARPRSAHADRSERNPFAMPGSHAWLRHALCVCGRRPRPFGKDGHWHACLGMCSSKSRAREWLWGKARKMREAAPLHHHHCTPNYQHRSHLPTLLMIPTGRLPRLRLLLGCLVLAVAALCVRASSSSFRPGLPPPRPPPRAVLVVVSAPLCPRPLRTPTQDGTTTTQQQAEAWRTAPAPAAAAPAAAGMESATASSSSSGRPITPDKAPSPPRTPPLPRPLNRNPKAKVNGMVPPLPHHTTNTPPALNTHPRTAASSIVPHAGPVAT
jgi:hypothetical protein